MDDSIMIKYKPKTFDELYMDNDLKNIINTLIQLELLNILIIGNSGSGKSTLISIIVGIYYDSNEIKNNVMYINNLNEQGIQYFRTKKDAIRAITKNLKRINNDN